MVDKTPLKPKKIPQGILLFLLLIIVEFFVLVLVALIPKSSVQQNFQESASFLCERDVFFYASELDKASKIDRYADSILLNIAYNYQSHSPVTSVMSSSYYFTFEENENVNLLTAVTDNPVPTLDYSRYWHGSIAIVRPLLILFNIEQIYIINLIILLIMFIPLFVLIKKLIGKAGVICFMVAAFMTSVWYVPMSLEYTWTIFIMLAISIIALLKIKSESYDFMLLFLAAGNATAFFDFLTTETLTFLVPATLIITCKYISGKLGSFKVELSTLIKQGACWLMGYLFTWIAKWSLASIILQKNVFLEAFNQAKYRTAGQADELSGFSQRLSAEIRNISNLFPFSTSNNHSSFFAIFFIIIILSIIFLIRKEKSTFNQLLLLMSILPYIRYFVLGNHSYLHHFFTFRAQLATILCLGLILVYGSDKTMLLKEWKKLWKWN